MSSFFDMWLRQLFDGPEGGQQNNQDGSIRGDGNNMMNLGLNGMLDGMVPNLSNSAGFIPGQKGTASGKDPRGNSNYRGTNYWSYLNWKLPGMWGPNAREDSLMFTEPVLRAAGKWEPHVAAGMNVGAAGSQSAGGLPEATGQPLAKKAAPKSRGPHLPRPMLDFTAPGLDPLGDLPTETPGDIPLDPLGDLPVDPSKQTFDPWQPTPNIPGLKFLTGSATPYSWVPAALGGLGGLASALGKDPVFNRHETSQYWRDDFKREFDGISQDARTDPYQGDYFRNANRAAITAAELSAKENANMQARQSAVTGNMFGGGTERFWSKMAPGFYANQGNLLAQGYNIRDRASQLENSYVNHNTDRQQDLFQFEVAQGTHSDYSKGANLISKALGATMAGASAFDNIYAKLWERDNMSKLFAKSLGKWVPEGGEGGSGVGGSGTPGTGSIPGNGGMQLRQGPYFPGRGKDPLPGPVRGDITTSWNRSGWFPGARAHSAMKDRIDPIMGTIKPVPAADGAWDFAGMNQTFHGIVPRQDDEYGRMLMPEPKSIPYRTTEFPYAPIGFGQYNDYIRRRR